ncbi:bactofilin family protein [Bacillus horti]|uniref:Cytoskeletal protein CcmA (Bactofilin family) n=1 Tax=Caldalkalibacillus horti TaxID=77523 RepID=A0ABT9W380_9BACI|nr:polymer-forming cytoskeletal protein [Bacillus horti]MDQ0167697.1 cytoskeletal protein CcmA (bactofilin family) [Bacillus horti]
MFSKNTQPDRINTVIGHGTKMEGKLESTSSIRIDGEFKGDVVTEGTVLVGKDGVILGNITAGSLTIEGLVEGNIQVSDAIQLVKGCQVKGDITAQTIEIEKGAIFNGHSHMNISNAKDKKKQEKLKANA